MHLDKEISQIGYAKEIITPPLGTLFAGYKPRYVEGVHDDLYARIILLSNKNELYVFVELDLLEADRFFIDFVGKRLNDLYNIKPENLFVNCIHTHSGPVGTRNPEGPGNEGYRFTLPTLDTMMLEYITRQVAGGVSRALKNMCPFTVSYRQSRLQGVGLNRRSPSKPIDDQLQVLVLSREDNKKIVIYNYGCHATVIHGLNKLVTADFPGETARILESQEEIACAAFFNGPCGDVSTRFTRRESSFSEVKRIGDILGGEVLKLVNIIADEEKLTKAQALDLPLSIKTKELPSLEDAEKELEEARKSLERAKAEGVSGGDLRLYESRYEGASSNLKLLKGFMNIEKIDITVKIIKLDDVFIVYFPGELFTSLGMMIKEAFAGTNVLIATLGNGYCGYVPDAESYKEGGQEVLASRFAPGEGERIVNEIIFAMKSINTFN